MPDLSSLVSKYSVVKQIPIFQKLNLLELRHVVTRSHLIEYKKGDIICVQGAPSEALYCLLSGRLQAYRKADGGKKENIEFILRGMHFGVTALLTGEGHSQTFEAINDSVVLMIKKEDFYTILRLIPRLGVELSHNLSRRIRSNRQGSKSLFESSVISIYSPVKGSGSSTYAVNLALSLQKETRRKVVLVAISSEIQEPYAVPSDVKEASPQWKQKPVPLKDIMNSHGKTLRQISHGEINIDLLHVSFDPQDTEVVRQIGQFVGTLANDFNYVVVDLPNSMDDVVLKTLTQSDLVDLVTLDHEEHLQATGQVIERLKAILNEEFLSERLKVLVCGLEAKSYVSYEEINQILGYNITAVLPHINHNELNAAVVSKDITVITPNPQSEYARTITRIARRVGGVRIGLALGGGAALGLAHIGVLRVLERENIPVDIVAGSSMGALLAGLWTMGKNSDELEKIAREFSSKKAMLKLLDPIFPKAALMGGRAINFWLKGHFGNATFHDTKIPLRIVAYDLIRREELVISEGLLSEAVRKSIAIPGVINPILNREQVIIDGGVLNPLPTNVLKAAGVSRIIAVNVLQSSEDASQGYDLEQEKLKREAAIPFRKSPRQYLGVRMHKLFNKIFMPNISDIIIRSLQATEYIIAQESARQADVVIHPDLVGVYWFELYRVNDLIQRGQDAAERHLAEIKDLVSR